jgi:hypothetical protein
MLRRAAGVGVADPAEIDAYPPRLHRDVVALACRAAQRRAGDRRVHVEVLGAPGTGGQVEGVRTSNGAPCGAGSPLAKRVERVAEHGERHRDRALVRHVGRQGEPVRMAERRVSARKADHTTGGSLSTGPSGIAESRIRTRPSTTATSTQPLVSDARLFRHAMHGSSQSATGPPLPPRGGTAVSTDSRGNIRSVWQACVSAGDAASA